MLKLLALVLSTAAATAAAAEARRPGLIIPEPTHTVVTAGRFTLTPSTPIIVPAALQDEALALRAMLRPATAFDLKIQIGTDAKAGAFSRSSITLAVEPMSAELGEEGYRFIATPDRVAITSATRAGVFYGIQTLGQLLPPEVASPQTVSGITWAFGAGREGQASPPRLARPPPFATVYSGNASALQTSCRS